MIEFYKDRYGNNHKWDNEFEKCHIPNCNNLVSAIENHNKIKSKIFCSFHSINGVKRTCEICKKEFTREAKDYLKDYPSKSICVKCARILHCKSEKMTNQAKILGSKTGSLNMSKAHKKDSIKFCEKCKEYTFHIIGVGCISCHNKTEKMRNISSKTMQNNWNNKEFFEKINCYPGFKEINNILYYYNIYEKDYIPWEEYKEKFKTQNINFKLPEEFKLHSTFRTQRSEDWSGARAAFEQSLVDEDITWFTYIKFYIDKMGNVLPLVVGKSGSLLVNSSGSDISFSIVNNGPARRYLYEENLEWCKTQIAIKKCNSETEALEKEQEIKLKFNLYSK